MYLAGMGKDTTTEVRLVSTADAAKLLGVSQRTVEAHRANVLQKLGISNTASLVRLAVLAGLGPPQG